MHRMKSLALVFTLVLMGAATTVDAAERFKIDPNHSSFGFLAGHLGFSQVLGRFRDIEGEFTFDQNDLAANTVKVSVKTASIDTNHQRRDDHLRSPDFFNTAEFPTMTFESTKVEKTGDNVGKLIGNVTLLGITKPVTFDVTFNKVGPNPLPQYNGILTAGFSIRGSIKRSEFGMTYGIPGVSDEIALIIEIEAQKAG